MAAPAPTTIISFDVGVINLAYAVLDVAGILPIDKLKAPSKRKRNPVTPPALNAVVGEGAVLRVWGVIAVCESKETIVATTTALVRALKAQAFPQPDVVLLESQSPRSPKNMVVAGAIHAYFAALYPDAHVLYMPPKRSLARLRALLPRYLAARDLHPALVVPLLGETGPTEKLSYSKKKRWATAFTTLLVAHEPYAPGLAAAFSASKKKDDFADALLQAYVYVEDCLYGVQ